MLIVQFLLTIILVRLSKENYTYDDLISFHWKGNLTSNSIVMKVFPFIEQFQLAKNLTVSLILFETFMEGYNPSKEEFLKSPFSITTADNISYPLIFSLEELNSNASYFYFFFFHKMYFLSPEELQSKLTDDIAEYYDKFIKGSDRLFKIKTTGPDLKPFSFKFGVASCARSGSESEIFREIYDLNPDILFFLHTGDLHYLDIQVDDIKLFEKAYSTVFSSITQRYLFEKVPIEYIWDDHDFGANDADAKTESRTAATLSYFKFVPHHDLRNIKKIKNYSNFDPLSPELKGSSKAKSVGDIEYGLYRSFAVGRIFFIILDLRSFRALESEKSMLGDEQYLWLQTQLYYLAENKESFKHVILISSVPWIGEGIDWSDYNEVRIEIANLINEYLLQKGINLLLITGDAHMLAFDTGRNNKYGGFPVLTSASLDQTGSCKGGPFTHGPFPGKDDYSIISIEDDNDKVCIKIQGIKKGYTLIEYNSCDDKSVIEMKFNKNHTCPTNFKTQLIIISCSFGGLILFFILIYLCIKIYTKKMFDPPRPILILPMPSDVNDSIEEKEEEQSDSYTRKEVLYTDLIDPKKNKTFQTNVNYNDSQENYLDELKRIQKVETSLDDRSKYSKFSARKGD